MRARICGHTTLLSAGDCELCDVVWLQRHGYGEPAENRENRREIEDEIESARNPPATDRSAVLAARRVR